MKPNMLLSLMSLFLLASADMLAVPVTFSVDMSGVSGFQPADAVDVRGPFNNWAGGTYFLRN